jgi:hypothetical protein
MLCYSKTILIQNLYAYFYLIEVYAFKQKLCCIKTKLCNDNRNKKMSSKRKRIDIKFPTVKV